MPTRGGSTALGGFGLIALGILSGLVLVVGYSEAFRLNLWDTWVPLPTSAIALLFALLSLATADAVVGVLLVLIGRQERNREEEKLLDPLSYPPIRRGWVRGLVWLVPVVALVVLPGLFAIPFAHPFHLDLGVGACAPGSPGSAETVSLPLGAMLVYQWKSADGGPVGEVVAPSGPALSVSEPYFFNSSAGYSLAESNGTAFTFSACDFGSSAGGGTPRTVEISGTYYTSVL
jgi:hypothetical protein